MPEITNVPNDAPVTAVPATIDSAFSKPLEELRQAAFPAEPVAPAPAVEIPAPTPVVEPQGDYQLVTTAEGVEIRLASGEVFKGKTEADAWPKVAAAKVQSERFIKELKRNNAPAAVVPSTPIAPTLTDADVDLQYWAIAGSQGKAAADRFYAQNRPVEVLNTFAAALGLQNGAELQSMLGNMRQTTEQLNGNMVAAAFHQANPDFPATDDASSKLVDYAVKAGLNPADPRHLSIAHAACLREKVYAPAAVAPAPVVPVVPAPMIPPTGGTPNNPGIDANSAWRMPITELQKQAFKR